MGKLPDSFFLFSCFYAILKVHGRTNLIYHLILNVKVAVLENGVTPLVLCLTLVVRIAVLENTILIPKASIVWRAHLVSKVNTTINLLLLVVQNAPKDGGRVKLV